MPHISRRFWLGLLGSGFTAPVAGCSRIQGDEPAPLRLGFKNFTNESQQIAVKLIKRNSEDMGNAQALITTYTVPVTKGGDANPVIKEELEANPYLVRTDLFAIEGMNGHYHFTPDCADSEKTDLLLITIAADDDDSNDPYVRYSQQRC